MPKRRPLDRIFECFQRRCPHNPRWVRADILEGEHYPKTLVAWCLRCGAYRRSWPGVGEGDWREPRATWAEGEAIRSSRLFAWIIRRKRDAKA